MSEVIDFNKIKNKPTDKDISKFEEYIYNLYYSMAQGNISLMELEQKIKEYMKNNNISEEKFKNIQKKLMEKYAGDFGINLDDLQNQIKSFGIDMKNLGINVDSEDVRKSISFHDKYKDRIKIINASKYYIKNDKNEVDILINEENVTIISKKSIDIKDNELNEFLCSYKKVIKDKPLKIVVCENTSSYEY